MKFRFIYTLFALLFFAFLFSSSSGGIESNRAGAPGDGLCSNCHTGSGAGGSSGITLTGVPTAYVEGTTYPLVLTLTDENASGNPNARGGFQIVATNGTNGSQVGTFSEPTGTRIVGSTDRLIQSTPKNFSGSNSVTWSFDWTAPSSGGPANIQFFYTGNAADGASGANSGDNAYAGSSASIPLPVELSYFDVKPMEDEIVKLNWQTQSEENSDYFEIERSQNESEFESIGRVFSAGNSIEVIDYEFEDRLPILNQFSYYRLKQVDLDGRITFSNVKSVKVDREGTLSIFPNPIKNNQTLNITYPNNNNLEKRVHIVNSMGAVAFEANLNNQNADGSYRFDFPELPVGIYFVSIFENQNLVEVEKLLIQ